MSDRNITLDTVNKVADTGAEVFGCEPTGFVLLYPDAALLKLT